MFTIRFIGGLMHGANVKVEMPDDFEEPHTVNIFDRTDGVVSTWEYKRTDWYMGPGKPLMPYYRLASLSDDIAIAMAAAAFRKC